MSFIFAAYKCSTLQRIIGGKSVDRNKVLDSRLWDGLWSDAVHGSHKSASQSPCVKLGVIFSAGAIQREYLVAIFEPDN